MTSMAPECTHTQDKQVSSDSSPSVSDEMYCFPCHSRSSHFKDEPSATKVTAWPVLDCNCSF